MIINEAEIDRSMRMIYEQCACIAERCGSDAIAAQIRKAAGTLKVKVDGARLSFSATWDPPADGAPVKP